MTTIEFAPEIAGQTRDTTVRVRRPSRFRDALKAWFHRWRQRRADRLILLELSGWDERLLKDIGFTAHDVKAALGKERYGIHNLRQY